MLIVSFVREIACMTRYVCSWNKCKRYKFRLEQPWSLKRMIFLFQGLTKKTGFVIVINNFMQKWNGQWWGQENRLTIFREGGICCKLPNVVIPSYYLGAVLGNLHRLLQRYSKINEPLVYLLVGIWVEPRVMNTYSSLCRGGYVFFLFWFPF